MRIVLVWGHHAGIRSRTLCVTGKLSATEPWPWPGNRFLLLDPSHSVPFALDFSVCGFKVHERTRCTCTFWCILECSGMFSRVLACLLILSGNWEIYNFFKTGSPIAQADIQLRMCLIPTLNS